MKLVTIQSTAVKSVFEVLKEILNDVNVYFTPKGVSIVTLDTARTSLVDLNLSADNFEEYECAEPIIAGINIANTFKLLKSITNNDVLTISITSKEFMDIEILSESKKQKSNFQLKLLDIDESQIEVPELDATCMTTMPSVDFQRICRDMNNIGSEIAIARHKNIMKLTCEGDFANQETTLETVENVDASVSGVFSLKYLNIFTKATGMCASVQIVQEQAFLILQYNVANLGHLKFYLATKATEGQ
jgi:proliferating cell nuclear antigen